MLMHEVLLFGSLQRVLTRMPQHQNTWLLKHGATIHEVAAQGYDTVNKWTHVLRTACAALGTRLCMSSMNRMILRGLSATSLHTAFKRSCGVGRGNSSRQGRDQHTSKGATTGYICGLPKHSCQPPHCTQPSSAPAGWVGGGGGGGRGAPAVPALCTTACTWTEQHSPIASQQLLQMPPVQPRQSATSMHTLLWGLESEAGLVEINY
jgi:hypothetical protein